MLPINMRCCIFDMLFIIATTNKHYVLICRNMILWQNQKFLCPDFLCDFYGKVVQWSILLYSRRVVINLKGEQNDY